MQHIDSSDFSELQKEIIQMRVEGSSLSQIIQRFNTKYGATKGKLTKQALIHCLEKSAIALKWDKGMKGEVITTSLAPILPFLKPQLARYAASRRANDDFTINEKVITKQEIINTINDKLKNNEKWKYLCIRESYPDYPTFCKEVLVNAHNDCRFLGRLPVYFVENYPPSVFD